MPRLWFLLLLAAPLVRAQAASFRLTQQASRPNPNQYTNALRAIFGLSVKLQAFLNDDEPGNFIVSPISAAVVGAQLMLGTSVEFRNQIADLLSIEHPEHFQNDCVLQADGTNVTIPFATFHLELSGLLANLDNQQSFTLRQKSALFYDSGVPLKKAFAKELRFFYQTTLQQLNFHQSPAYTQHVINDWVTRSTNGLIRSILSYPPGQETASIFVNTIYFLAEWETMFDDVLNRRGNFTVKPNQQVPVTYMINSLEEIRYIESKNYEMIALPYKNRELSMYAVLPKRDNPNAYKIKAFVQTLVPSELTREIHEAKPRSVVIKLPKMTLTHSFSILEQVKKFYLYKMHQQNQKPATADDLKNITDRYKNYTVQHNELNRNLYLTNASETGNLRIDDIVQQVVLSVNERGTEAGVATATTIDYIGGQRNILLDRPFVFFIRHEATQAMLFWGTIANPLG